MDYKYIEQLLERYWQCETTLEEEKILQTFFSQPEVPAHLARYKALFVYGQQEKEQETLGEDFDQKICQRLGIDTNAGQEKEDDGTITVKARRITFFQRLRPLYHAAAAIAVVALFTTGAQHIFSGKDTQAEWDYNANAYQDSYKNPQEAYESFSDGIEEVKNILNTTTTDSIETKAASGDSATVKK